MDKDLSFAEDLELKLDGKRPIRRENPKKGQSRWYYVDPRGRDEDFTLLSQMKTIDVPSPNTPNPALQQVMFEDAENNPDKYYIWRTVGDDKVRDSHAEREGCIFSWDDAPEGGHPGEDYNCRCIAEPYVPRKDSSESDEQWRQRLLTTMKEYLLKEENLKNHIYLDTKGFKTVGAGKNIDKWEDFKKINWEVDGRPATEEEKLAGFERFEELKQQKFFGPNVTSDFFEDKSNLRISEKEAERLLEQHIKNDLNKLETYVSGFRNFPFELQQVLLDIRYNTGNADRRNWPNLYEAIDKRDIRGMANNVNRKDVGESRNQWAKETILSIKNWGY